MKPAPRPSTRTLTAVRSLPAPSSTECPFNLQKAGALKSWCLAAASDAYKQKSPRIPKALTHKLEATHVCGPAPPRRKRKWRPSSRPSGRPAPWPGLPLPGSPRGLWRKRAVMAFCAPGAYLTHQQKVLRLYKRALRHLESYCVHRWERGT